MFKNKKAGFKIIGGFTIALLLTFIVGLVSLNAIGKIEKKLDHLVSEMQTDNETAAQSTLAAEIQQIKKSTANDRFFLMILLAIALGTGAILAFFITQSIVNPVKNIIEGLSQNAEQVSASSEQVASSSQSLADGASHQAASIEETSSSLEEMASMTKQNADNANQADTLMKESNTVVEKANQSMDQLTHSIEDISKASEETQKIIKTIDEIAFQTNLLALNAAVEAARAGEAGAGFAVVADEVRNLAMRSAEAARNTAQLIEGTVKKVNDGTDLVKVTNDAFNQVTGSSAKIGELIAEIAAASDEQARGIEEINRAVTEMDRVTQQNAANAEQSASASQEMNHQADQMKTHVTRMIRLVGEQLRHKPAARRQQAGHRSPSSQNRGSRQMMRTGTTGSQSPQQHKKPALPNSSHSSSRTKTQSSSPEQVIPLDDDFKDF